MVDIPKLLQRNDFRFILVKPHDKIPIEKDWQNTNNYKYDDTKLLKHIENGGNYGAATGHGNLVVIDFDDEDLQNKLSSLLPKTFMCMSGSGLLHLYFIVDEPETLKILDEHNNTLADIQGPKKQIIAPGSIHPNGNHYTIIADREIASITMVEIKAIFGDYIKIKGTEKKSVEQHSDKYCEEIRSKLKIIDLLGEAGVPTDRNPTECPFHSSKGGKCFSVSGNGDLWHCFHCGKGGDLFNLHMGITGLDFPKSKKALAKRLGIKIEVVNMAGLKVNNFFDNVQLFYEHQPFFFDKAKIFWFWNQKSNKWEIVDEIDLMNSLDQQLGFAGLTINSRIKNEYLEAFKRVGRLNMPETLPRDFIQFKNKLFNLKTKDLIDADSKYFCCNPIPWDLGEDDSTPVMDKLFKDWVGNLYETLYEIIAYCCFTDYPIHLAFCLIGSGRNGKTQFQKIMFKFFGNDNVTASDLDAIMDNRFESFKLYKKLVCLMGETNFGVFDKSSVFKKVTGGDLISFEKKGKDPFNDFSYAKIIINSNSLPITEDTSEGFYRRWFIIDFANNFPEGKDIFESIPEQEFHNLCRKIVNILPKLLDKGMFSNQGTIEERKARYIEASNPVSLFIENYCIVRDDIYVKSADLYVAYTKYLKHKKRRIVTRRDFNKLMAEEGIIIEKKNLKIREEWVSGYYAFGIALIDGWENWDNKSRDIRDGCDVFPTLPLTLEKQSIEHSTNVTNVTDKGDTKEHTIENNQIKEERIGPKPVIAVGDVLELFPEGQEITGNWLIHYFGNDCEEEILECIKILIKQGEIYECKPDTYKKL